MHDKLHKMLAKKRDLSGPEKHAKMDVVKHLRGEASDAMKDHMGHFQKATVLADSPEHLQEGLSKAKEVVSSPEFNQMREDAENPYSDAEHAREEHDWKGGMAGYNEGGEVEDSPAEEESESPEEEGGELEGLSHEELQGLQQKIQKLLENK